MSAVGDIVEFYAVVTRLARRAAAIAFLIDRQNVTGPVLRIVVLIGVQ